jgi:hypothetical protein
MKSKLSQLRRGIIPLLIKREDEWTGFEFKVNID